MGVDGKGFLPQNSPYQFISLDHIASVHGPISIRMQQPIPLRQDRSSR